MTGPGVTSIDPDTMRNISGSIRDRATDFTRHNMPLSGGDWESHAGSDEWIRAVDEFNQRAFDRHERHAVYIDRVTGRLVQVDSENAAQLDAIRGQVGQGINADFNGNTGQLAKAVDLQGFGSIMGPMVQGAAAAVAGVSQAAAGLGQGAATVGGQLVSGGANMLNGTAKNTGVGSAAPAAFSDGAPLHGPGAAATTSPASGGAALPLHPPPSAGPGTNAVEAADPHPAVPTTNPTPMGGVGSGLAGMGNSGAASNSPVTKRRIVTAANADEPATTTETELPPVVAAPIDKEG